MSVDQETKGFIYDHPGCIKGFNRTFDFLRHKADAGPSEFGCPHAGCGGFKSPPSHLNTSLQRVKTQRSHRHIPFHFHKLSSLKTSGCETYEFGTHRCATLNKRLAMETEGHYLGAMPVSTFINHFFPSANCTISPPGTSFATVISDTVKIETDMYDPFIAAANKLCSSLKFYNTHSNPDFDCDNLATNVTAYNSKNRPSNSKQTEFSRMELFVEFKFDANADPFTDSESHIPNPHFEHDSDAAWSLRGQLASYVAALAGSQFRTHVFTIIICGRRTRLMFWDRNGAVVSRSFDYIEHNYLDIFLQQFDKDVDRRGHDPSVTIAEPSLLRDVPIAHQNDLRRNERHRDFWIMMIPDRDNASERSGFLISYPPKYTSRSPFGKATRPMVAYDLKESRLVFVKDYWRPITSDKEGDIYSILVEHKVPHIATFCKGNDIEGNVTVTDKLRTESWASPTTDMVALQNYRMSLKEVGRRLSDFKSSYEFVSSVANAMEAHDGAFFDARILHRDISVGNIIITKEGEGLLIDWDLCINLRNEDAATRRPERTGTWQFMSAKLLSDTRLKQGIEDDRESAFYVLLYLGLLYTKNNQMYQELESYMEIFDYVTFDYNSVAKGGALKRVFLATQGRADALDFDCKPMNDLMMDLRSTFSVRYEPPLSEAVLANYEYLRGIPDAAVALLYHPAPLRETRQNTLRERGWLFKTIEKHLENEWPDDDAARRNDLLSKKRKRQDTE